LPSNQAVDFDSLPEAPAADTTPAPTKSIDFEALPEPPPDQQPADLTAFRAQRAGVEPGAAAEALTLSKKRGLSPQFVADNLETVRAEEERNMLAASLSGLPVTAGYAGQSAVHAAAVKDDVGPLEALEMGLADVGYAVAARHYMDEPSSELAGGLVGYEEAAQKFAERPSGLIADVARALPSLAVYGGATVVGGGPIGLGFALYQLNRGVLYRRIWANAPIPEDGKDWDPEAFDKLAKEYAKKGAITSATIGAVLGSPFTRALPGASDVLGKIGVDIVAKSAGEATVKRLAEYGGHTLSGALMMAGQATIDDATVQKATTGKIDAVAALAAGGKAFEDGLAVAAVLSAYTPGRDLVRDLGRARAAPVEVAQLDHLVEQAKASKLVQRSPAEAEQLVGQMAAQGDTSHVYVDGEAAAKDPKVTAKLVEALADEGRALAEAQATAGDVAVPIEKYLTQLGDEHQVLREDVKLAPDGMTLREAQEAKSKALVRALAERSLIKDEPADAPNRRERLQAAHEKIREAAMAQYGGTPEEWARILTPETVDHVQAALAPSEKPLPGTQIDGRAATEWAKELIDDQPVGEIHPGRYELAARRAEDKLAEVAKEGAEKASAAARQGFVAAGARALGVGTVPEAGTENLRAAGRTADVADRRLGKLPMLERARDLARAMAAHAADVRTEMDKGRDYLAKRDTPTYRAELSLAGPEYLAAWTALQEAIDNNTPRAPPNPQALETLLERMGQEGQLVGFDEQGIRDLLSGNRGWKKLTPPEARNVVDAAKNIRLAARQVNEIQLSDKTLTLRETVGAITDEASTRKDLGAPPLTDSAATLLDMVARKAGLINADNLKPETIFDRLGDTAHRFYEEKLIAARNRKAELQGEHLKYFIENFDKEMRGLRKWLREPVRTTLTIPEGVDLDGTKINNETLAMAFLNLGSPGNEQRLLSGYGWDAAQIREEIGKKIPVERLRFLQGILSFNDEKLWPLIREHAESHTGIAPTKVQAQPITIHFPDGTSETFEGGYFPAAPNRRALGVPEHMQAGIAEGVDPTDQYARATVQAAFTKERTKKATYPVDLNWSRYPAHLASVFHYLAYDDAVRDVGKLLRDGEFQKTVRHYVGEPYLDQLKQDQRIWARGSVDTSQLGYLDRMASSVLRTRAVSNALAFSTPIALGQESHIQYAIASGQISLKNATAAMTRQVPWSDTWVATRAVLDEVRFRSDRYPDQFREAISGQPARTVLGHGADRAAFAQMEAADAILSHVIGDAALNDALDAKMSTEDAVREANRKVRLLMPTHNTMEMAPIVRSRGTIGALMLFRGLPNVVWNVESGLYDEARQGVAGALGAGQLTAASVRVAMNTARAAASLAVLHMLGRLLMGHGKKDEDGEGLAGWATWAEREAISSQFSRIPLGRDVMEPFVDAYFHDKDAQTAIRELASGQHLAPDVAVIHGILKDLGKIASDASEPEDKVQGAVSTALTALGIGGRQITRTGRYAYDLLQGNVEARGPGDVVGGLIHGQRPRQDKNLPVAIQDTISGE